MPSISRLCPLLLAVACSFAVTLTATLAVPGPVQAQSGGTEGGSGGARIPPRPIARGVECVARCVGLRAGARGTHIAVTGARLSHVAKVEFIQGDRRRRARTRVMSSRRVEALVPSGLRRGRTRIRVIDVMNRRSRLVRRSLRVEPTSALAHNDGAPPAVVSSEASPRTFAYGRRRSSAFSFVTRASEPATIRVDVTSAADGDVIRSFVERGIRPNTVRSVSWNGRDADGRIVDPGRYLFVARPEGIAFAGSARELNSSQANVGAVDFVRYMFPVRGRVRAGDGLGAGRGHQGFDLFARCGTRMVAAIGGWVLYNSYHGRAGYYVVIRGEDGIDYFYAHLLRRSPLRPRTRVSTGQTIGQVGETGNASGCHLHFEMWSRPGWQRGGRVLDPLPHLRAWASTR